MDKFLDKFAAFPARYKYFILAGFVLLCGGAFWYFVYTPKMEEITSLDAQLKKLQDELVKAEAQAARYDEFKDELRKVELDLKDALKKLPRDKEIPNLLDQINSSVIDAGLTISSFQTAGQTLKEAGFYYEVPVQIQVSGGYHNFAMFADVISKMERIVTLRNMSLTPIGQDGTILNVSCTAVTFRQAPEQETTPAK